jgi:hypothetical protein
MGGSSSNLVYLNQNNFSIETNMLVKCDIVKKNIDRYQSIIFPSNIEGLHPANNNKTILLTLLINITQNARCPGYPSADMDESCELILLIFRELNSRFYYGLFQMI